MIWNGTTKSELNLVEWKITLKFIWEGREGVPTHLSINLCKNTKLASILLSAKEVSPNLSITELKSCRRWKIFKMKTTEKQKRLWILSKWNESATIKGSQRIEEYSKRDQTRKQ